MILRGMVEADLAPLAAIVAENYNPICAQMFWTEAACAFYPYPFRPRFIVAEIDNKPVGCACWNADWCSWGVFNISWVQVAKPLQRRGIGRLLVDGVLAELRPQAALVLLTTTVPDYYLRWGFAPLLNYPATTEYQDGTAHETLMALSHSSPQRQGGAD